MSVPNDVLHQSAKWLYEAAMLLRDRQRAYMADRGNETKGAAVGDAAADLDRAINYYRREVEEND